MTGRHRRVVPRDVVTVLAESDGSRLVEWDLRWPKLVDEAEEKANERKSAGRRHTSF
jgi:hypothetical protein